MAIGDKRTLLELIGSEHLGMLKLRCETMLLGAYAAAGAIVGPRSVTVHVADAMGIAAVRVLAASGLLAQKLDGDQSTEVYGAFEITSKGMQAARLLL